MTVINRVVLVGRLTKNPDLRYTHPALRLQALQLLLNGRLQIKMVTGMQTLLTV